MTLEQLQKGLVELRCERNRIRETIIKHNDMFTQEQLHGLDDRQLYATVNQGSRSASILLLANELQCITRVIDDIEKLEIDFEFDNKWRY